MKVIDRDSVKKWDSFVRELRKSRNIDYSETPKQKKARIDSLLGDFFAFSKYYFPNVCKSEFAKWHKDYVNYILANNQAFAVCKVSRDMAKSSVTALLIIYSYYRGEVKSLGYFSHIQTQSEMLLNAVKVAFEKNDALRRDYGSRIGSIWTSSRFITNDGASFRAVGAGQNPRGEKNEDADRFDWEIFDDFDDPEVCRNPERLDNNWKYVQGDCLAAFHVTGRRKAIFLNNKIGEDCIIQRAWDHAKTIPNSYTVIVNLVDKNGKSNWVAYTDEECKYMLDLVGDEAETEYMNNPVNKGKEFLKEWFVFKKMPPLREYKYLVTYLDGGFKKTRTSDTKALILMGIYKGELHIRKVYVDNVSINTMIDWHYDLHTYLKDRNGTAQWWMEEVFLLSMLHDHFYAAVPKYKFRIPVLGDKRKKPDKDLRISNTAGYYERGNIFFCESIKDDRHTKRLITQYLRFRKGLTNIEKDGPDAVEGAIHKLQEMATSGIGAGKSIIAPRKGNKHRV
jgi:hypothetical protein